MSAVDWAWPTRLDRAAGEATLRLDFFAQAAGLAGPPVLFTTAARFLRDLGSQESTRALARPISPGASPRGPRRCIAGSSPPPEPLVADPAPCPQIRQVAGARHRTPSAPAPGVRGAGLRKAPRPGAPLLPGSAPAAPRPGRSPETPGVRSRDVT